MYTHSHMSSAVPYLQVNSKIVKPILQTSGPGYQCLDMEGGNEGTRERGKGEMEGEKQHTHSYTCNIS